MARFSSSWRPLLPSSATRQVLVDQASAVNQNCPNFLRVVNVLWRVGIEPHQVSQLAFFDGAEPVEHAHEFRGIVGRCLQGVAWSEPGLHK